MGAYGNWREAMLHRGGALLHPCGVFDCAGSEGAEALNDCLIATTGKVHLRRLEFPEDFYVAVHFCFRPLFCHSDEESGDQSLPLRGVDAAENFFFL